MAKKAKQVKQETVETTTEAAVVAVAPSRLRLPLPEARDHNKQFSPVLEDATVEAAAIALTSKGTNPRKERVYGYDNLTNGGGVPKTAKVVVVPGATAGVPPKGVKGEQWDLLVSLAGGTVQHLYDNKVHSRTIRRAYRAGAIRFAA